MKTLVPDNHDGNVPLRLCSSPFLSKPKVIKISTIIVIIVFIIMVSLFKFPAYSDVPRFAINLLRPSPRPPSHKMTDYKSYNTSDYKKRYPQAMIMGARKGGTTALLYFLNYHEGIVVADEVHWYDWNFGRSKDWYLGRMGKSYPGQVTLEKSPNYFYDEPTPKRIHKRFPSMKLILTLRNPVERSMSDYLHIKEDHQHEAHIYTFEKLVYRRNTGKIDESYMAVWRSLYYIHLQRWLKYFKLSQFLIIDGDNIIRRPWEELSKVEEFLGVDHELRQSRFVYNYTKGFYCIDTCLGDHKGRPHPRIEKKVEKKLQEFFRPYNEKLFKLIGRRFDWN